MGGMNLDKKTKAARDALWDRIEKGEIDYAVYRSYCPHETKACADIACEGCRYFMPAPEKVIPVSCNSEDDLICSHCKSSEVALAEIWQPQTEIPTIDGVHRAYEYDEENAYARVYCADCKLVSDFKWTGELNDQSKQVAIYANEVREQFSRLGETIIEINASLKSVSRAMSQLSARIDQQANSQKESDNG